MGASVYVLGSSVLQLAHAHAHAIVSMFNCTLTKLIVVRVILVPRLVPFFSHVLRSTMQASREDQSRIIQKIPLRRVAPVSRAIQWRRTPGPYGAEQHIYNIV